MYLLLSLIKVLDNVILTAKSIATYKGRKILSSILVVISQLLFYLVINQVINDNTMMTIIIVSISSGIGNYIAFLINEKFKKDDVWTNVITSNDKTMLLELCDMLRENRVKYLLYDTYDRQFEQSYTITAFTKTKAESKLIDGFLKQANTKYLRMIDGMEVK
jgi:uncharacterized protein YebE (UPF0316 family)